MEIHAVSGEEVTHTLFFGQLGQYRPCLLRFLGHTVERRSQKWQTKSPFSRDSEISFECRLLAIYVRILSS